jgi:hypothetical protein
MKLRIIKTNKAVIPDPAGDNPLIKADKTVRIGAKINITFL